MKNILASFLIFLVVPGCAQNKSERQVGGNCEDCEMMFQGMPSTISSEYRISGSQEPGEPMEISGVVYRQDGKTPASDVIVYVYHTDNKGEYSPGKGAAESTRHGHLRGWAKTDQQGKYKFTSIRPVSYPNSRNPQHVHAIIKEPGLAPYWIDEYLFEDDPFLDNKTRSFQEGRGGKGIIKLSKNNGVWTGTRNIILGQNIAGY